MGGSVRGAAFFVAMAASIQLVDVGNFKGLFFPVALPLARFFFFFFFLYDFRLSTS